MTLLRTIGLVLKKVDHPARNARMKRAIDDHWRRLKGTKPEPRIFWEFIDAERNAVVHLYDPSAAVIVTSRLGGANLCLGAGAGSSSLDEPMAVDFFMRKGPFKERDPRELCREAITFWKDYLDAIDRDAER